MDPLPPVDSAVAKIAGAGVTLPNGRLQITAYGDSPELSRELLALIRDGHKRAGASLLWSYEADAEPLPMVGDIQIVVDHRHEPSIVTRVTMVEVKVFRDVSGEYAAIEGEGDGSLEYWRRTHWDFFSRECARIAREPRQDMPVVCCVFEVLNVLPEQARP
jgi:uncharacterized protein YhfF